MNRVEVENKVKVYAVDGEEEEAFVTVKSHCNESAKIVLRIGGHEYEVFGSDLIVATENSMRTA